MKKIFLCVLATTVALASCSKIETTKTGNPQEITFKTIATKAETGLDQGIAIGVHAQITGKAEYFGNTEFAFNADKNNCWACATPKYWPNSGSLDFTVYAPYATSGLTLSTGSIELSPVPTDCDFLYGKEFYKEKTKIASQAIVLKHAKAQVIVNVQSDADNLYKVTKIVLNKAPIAGSVKVTYKGKGVGQEIVDWTPGVGTAEVTLGSTPSGTAVTAEATAYGNPATVVPGDLGVTASAGTVAQTSLTVSYTMNGKAVADKVIDLSGEGAKWEVGNRYVYNLKFVAEEILFDVKEDPWTDHSNNINKDI